MTALQHLPKRSSVRLKPSPSDVQDDQLTHSAAKQKDGTQPINLNGGAALSPATLMRLQGTVGNHAVQRMLKQQQPGTIQRDGTDDAVTTIENLSGQVSNFGDMVGNEKGLNQSTGGGVMGTVGSVGGMVIGGIKVGVHGKNLHQVNKDLKTAKEEPDQTGMQATITLLERKKAAAQKGIAEGSGTIVGGISGFIGSVAGFFTSSAGQAVSHWLGPIGAGLGVLLGTIAAIRDFMNIHKRRKAKEAIGVMIGGYADVATQLGDEIQNVRSQYTNIGSLPKSQQAAKLLEMKNKVEAIETKIDGVDKMRMALALAKRKQGFGGKIASGITNLIGVAGGGALLALGIGALGVAGVGAAAGPVGWALVGVAAVAALSYFIGVKVKQAIRKSNVTRMNQEITLVDEFINTGKVNGQPLMVNSGVDATTLNSQQRQAVMWQRSMFPTTETKGWFNKLFSKSKSGKLTIADRKKELTEYLAKYDKEAASNTVWEGFKKALLPGEEGDMMVDNPKYDPQNTKSGEPQKITLRQQITGLIEFYFPGKSPDFIKSIVAGGSKEQNARSLLMQKMKLEDK